MPFQCSICGEESTRICVRCTTDACHNHLCEKCLKCSDCCECEVAISPHVPGSVRAALQAGDAPPAEAQAIPVPEAEPAPQTEPPAWPASAGPGPDGA